MIVSITYGHTESGDDLINILWEHRPIEEEINEAYKKLYPQEYEEVGFVNWKIDSHLFEVIK